MFLMETCWILDLHLLKRLFRFWTTVFYMFWSKDTRKVRFSHKTKSEKWTSKPLIEVQHVAFGFVRWNIGLPCHSLWFWRMNDTCCFIFATCHNTLKLQQLYASIDTLNHKKLLRKENNNSSLNNTSQKKWWPSFHFWKSSVFVVMSTLIMDYTLLTRWMW